MREYGVFAIFLFLTVLIVVSCGEDNEEDNGVITDTLVCNGTFRGTSAVVEGKRTYEPYNQLGDAYIRFSGTLKTNFEVMLMKYEGYTNLAPFKGTLQTLQGLLLIAVLDALPGDQMIIYDGVERLGPPEILGQFVCVWNP